MGDRDGVSGPVTLVESVAASVAAATRAGIVDAVADQAAVDLAMRYALVVDQEIDAGGSRAAEATRNLLPLLQKNLRVLACSPVGRMEIAAGPVRRGRPTKQEAAARRRAQAARDARG